MLESSIKKPSTEMTEYFLLASYSCLPNVIARLEYIREKNRSAVLFCLTGPLYLFLQRLSEHYTWIKVHYVDATEAMTRSIRNPLNWWQSHREVKSLYKKWFAEIPNNQIVHFYNRYGAPFLFYIIWHLKDDQIIHYTASDPVGLHPESHRILSYIQKLVFLLIYQVPIRIVNSAGRRTATLPALTSEALSQMINVEHKESSIVADIRTSELYQVLSWRSDAQALWVMGLLLDMDEVSPAEYSKILSQCIDAVNSAYAPGQQAIKFHPRAQKRETGWTTGVEYVSDYVPAEFIILLNLKIILTISSTVVSTLGMSSDVKVISLVELIPFRDEATRDAHRRLIQHFGIQNKPSVPSSITELRECVTRRIPELPAKK